MANISGIWTEEIELPDGTVATSKADVEKYLRANNAALASDYSGEYQKNIRLRNEKAQRKQAFSDFVLTYKRMIWNE